MKRKVWLFLSVILILSLSAIAGVSAQETNDNIVDVIATDARFSSLYDYVISAGLANTLASASHTYTVFAPRNQAFAAIKASDGEKRSATLIISEDELFDLLNYHIVPGKLSSSNLTDGQTLTTLFGEKLDVEVDDGQISINGALITTVDIPAKNGVIHIVNDLLVPSTITLPEVERAGSNGSGGNSNGGASNNGGGGSSQGSQNPGGRGSPAPGPRPR